MHRALVVFFFLISSTHCRPLDLAQRLGEKDILWISVKDETRLAEKLAKGKVSSHSVKRDRTGDRLFVEFADLARTYHLAVVSSNGVQVRKLPGQSCVNDREQPVFWLDTTLRTIQFAGGYTLPTNVHTMNFISDGEFVTMFSYKRLWIARVSAPMEELIRLSPEAQVQKIISHGDKLHIFVRGQPEGKPRSDGWDVLKHYEYKVEATKASQVKIQDFDFTWGVFDFDPQTNLMLARSWDTMFPDAWLVNTTTGERERLKVRGEAFFLKRAIVQKFKEILAEK